MPLNVGYVELGGAGVVVRVYYDTTFTPVGDDQPLVNGPRGWCLDMTNTTGQRAVVTVDGLTVEPFDITIAQGDPVVTGPTSGRSKTAAQMASLGLTTRGDLGVITLTG